MAAQRRRFVRRRNLIGKIDSYVTLPSEVLSQSEWREVRPACTDLAAGGTVYECIRPRVRSSAVRLRRGAWSYLPDHVRYRDRRSFPKYPKIELSPNFKLDAKLPDGREFHGQRDAVRAILENEQGIVLRPPGSGKTQIAVAFIAAAATSVLVLVHTEDVLEQWRKYFKDAGIPDVSIGIIRGQQRRPKQVTLCMVQTFYKEMIDNPERWRDEFGAVIVDECHHAPAATWEVILNNLNARYRIGLTASATRADGHHPYIRLLIGPVIHKQPFESKVKLHVEVVRTDFQYRYRGSWDWGNLLRALIRDPGRNDLIAGIADGQIRRGRSVLVLSRNIEHLERIAERMDERSEILAAKLRTN